MHGRSCSWTIDLPQKVNNSTFHTLPSLVKKIFNIFYRAEAPRYKAIKPNCGQLQKMVIKQEVNEKQCYN